MMIGDNYFGEDNCECLCKTCEVNYQNGWSAGANAESCPKPSIEEQPSNLAYSLRRRRHASTNSSRNQSETPDVNLRPHVPKRTPKTISRFKNADSPVGKSPSVEPAQTPAKRKRDFEPSTSPDLHTAKKFKAESPVKVEDDDTVAQAQDEVIGMKEPIDFIDQARLSLSPPSSSVQSNPASSPSSPSDGATSTDATSVDEETIIVETKSTTAVVSKRRTKRKRKLPRPTADLDHAPAIRIPGDYVLTPALLGEPASAWINCRHCEEPFVQKDAYYTRSSCPRCERHSKLYGYVWPKADKEGKYDTEQRVLDHRTVHRFIRPSEEKTVRKRDRSSADSRAVTREVSEAVPEKSEAPKKRGGRRKVKTTTI